MLWSDRESDECMSPKESDFLTAFNDLTLKLKKNTRKL